MAWLWWMLVGVAVGAVAMLPVTRVLLRRVERRARDAEGRARDAERLAELGSMTGGLAHEIKNPLSTIGLNAQLLAEGLAEAEMAAPQRERLTRRLQSLSREVERLRSILTDFLQYAGRIKLDLQPRDVTRIVDELIDFFHPQCDQAGIVLRAQQPEVGERIVAQVDEGLLKQAVLNLMINAVQAMAPDAAETARRGRRDRARGELMLRLQRDGGEAQLHVIDTGPGIDRDRLREIFLPYVSHKSGGTGLGLATARRIIEEHGGRLTVDSEPGKGSDFIVHLPLAQLGVAGGASPIG